MRTERDEMEEAAEDVAPAAAVLVSLWRLPVCNAGVLKPESHVVSSRLVLFHYISISNTYGPEQTRIFIAGFHMHKQLK